MSAKVIILLSDLHVGATAGLLPPDFVTFEGNEIKQNPYQKWLWESWLECWKWSKDIIGKDEWIGVINGDLIDGNHHMTREIISPDTADHISAAIDILKPVLKTASGVYLTEGTNVHVQNSEHGIASSLRGSGIKVISPNTRKGAWPEMDIVIHGCRCAIDHHVSTSTKPATESSVYSQTLSTVQDRYCRAGWKVPKFIVRSHRHQFGYFSDGYRSMVILPPWQGATRFTRRVVPRVTPQCGMVIADWRNVERGEPPVIHHRIYTTPQDTPHFL